MCRRDSLTECGVCAPLSSRQGGKEYLMRAHFGLPSVEAEDKEGKPPISVKFEIPYFTTSGIQVSSLVLTPTCAQTHAHPLTRAHTDSTPVRTRTHTPTLAHVHSTQHTRFARTNIQTNVHKRAVPGHAEPCCTSMLPLTIFEELGRWQELRVLQR